MAPLTALEVESQVVAPPPKPRRKKALAAVCFAGCVGAGYKVLGALGKQAVPAHPEGQVAVGAAGAALRLKCVDGAKGDDLSQYLEDWLPEHDNSAGLFSESTQLRHICDFQKIMQKDDPAVKGLKALPTPWVSYSVHKLAVGGLYYPVPDKENVYRLDSRGDRAFVTSVAGDPAVQLNWQVTVEHTPKSGPDDEYVFSAVLEAGRENEAWAKSFESRAYKYEGGKPNGQEWSVKDGEEWKGLGIEQNFAMRGDLVVPTPMVSVTCVHGTGPTSPCAPGVQGKYKLVSGRPTFGEAFTGRALYKFVGAEHQYLAYTTNGPEGNLDWAWSFHGPGIPEGYPSLATNFAAARAKDPLDFRNQQLWDENVEDLWLMPKPYEGPCPGRDKVKIYHGEKKYCPAELEIQATTEWTVLADRAARWAEQ